MNKYMGGKRWREREKTHTYEYIIFIALVHYPFNLIKNIVE